MVLLGSEFSRQIFNATTDVRLSWRHCKSRKNLNVFFFSEIFRNFPVKSTVKCANAIQWKENQCTAPTAENQVYTK